MTATILPYSLAILLVAGLAISLLVRRPPSRLGPPLLLYQVCVLVYLVGDMITRLSREMWLEELGIAVLYTGAIPGAAACWVLTIRYAEAQGRPLPWARGWWIRGPIVASALAWVAMITNPLHGQFVTPVIGANNEHHWLWWAGVSVGYVLVPASLFLHAVLAWTSRDRVVRRNAWLMVGAMAVTIAFNLLSYAPATLWSFDPTVVGLAAASSIFLYGAYRTQLFSLLPAAVREGVQYDPDGLILVDLDGCWLRSNQSAAKLLGSELAQPGRDVISLIARRFRGPDGETLAREELVLRLLQGPRARSELIGPLCGGDAHWVEISATPIPRSEGRARAVSLRIHDVSARVAIEEQLRRARQELQNQAGERRQVDGLLGDVLRDVGRALGAADDPERTRGLLQRIRRTAERARHLSGAVIPKH